MIADRIVGDLDDVLDDEIFVGCEVRHVPGAEVNLVRYQPSKTGGVRRTTNGRAWNS